MNNADEFLRQKTLFQLGDLPTETPHPRTTQLSDWALRDPEHALKTLREIDLRALMNVADRKAEYASVFTAIADTFEGGGRVFLVGCGATGRLSLSLEYLWRRAHPGSDQVVAFMAGGDVALVQALEGFEDFPELGARHLRELGFTSNDLLVASTEGGETPFVIGATLEASRLSTRKPLFLHCNTPEILRAKVERSRRVLDDPGILSFHLPTGPMALTGSTRMQASTVLMLVIGLAFDFGRDVDEAFRALESWIRFFTTSPVAPLKSFLLAEAEAYGRGDRTLYTVDDTAITVFTDTTERSPTFNLAPFDNPANLTDRHSLTYITIPSAATAAEAWRKLLGRDPRPLEWPEVHPRATHAYLQTFDFGRAARNFRRAILADVDHHEFRIDARGDRLSLSFRGLDEEFALPGGDLFNHLTLKMILNAHSTLVFGRLGRYQGNLMTWLYPSNGKLVDRAARYTQILLAREGREHGYDEIVRAQFAAKADLNPNESIVGKTISRLRSAGVSRLAAERS